MHIRLGKEREKKRKGEERRRLEKDRRKLQT